MKIVCHVQYLMNSISYDHEFWRTCVKWWYLQAFFLLYIFGFSRQLGREKGKKWPQMTKTFCPLHFIYQEPYIIWLSFMVHLCKMMISPGVFFNFSQFWFSELLGPKWEKILSAMLHILGIIHCMILIYGTHV